jgi:hypothetical protein
VANKRFKDPIYGYIEIDASLIMQVVDTAEFQRLRDVIQTSYSPLYSSAVHNRFAHSIGVYYLGKMAAEAFHESIRAKSLQVPENISQYIEVFELACLLHDVGHAPFSHTGEQFYLYKGERVRLHKTLIQLTYYNRKTTEETLSIAGLIDDLLTLSTNRAVGNRLI